MEFRVAPTRTGRRTAETSFRFGIEEEYFLCDAHALEAMMRTPDDLFTDGHPHRGACLNREMLQAQIEVGKRPLRTAITMATVPATTASANP